MVKVLELKVIQRFGDGEIPAQQLGSNEFISQAWL